MKKSGSVRTAIEVEQLRGDLSPILGGLCVQLLRFDEQPLHDGSTMLLELFARHFDQDAPAPQQECFDTSLHVREWPFTLHQDAQREAAVRYSRCTVHQVACTHTG